MSSGERPGAYRLLLLVTAVLFSTGGAAIKMAALSGWQVASYRSGIGAIFLWIVLPEARRGWTWRTWLGGLAYASVMVLFVLANKLTTAANAILLQSTYPLYMLVLGPVLLKEKLRAADVLAVCGVCLGAWILFSGPEHAAVTAPDPVRGNIVGLASGLAWALTLAALRWVAIRNPGGEPAAAVAIAGNAIAFAVCLPLAVGGPTFHLESALVVLYLGLFQVGLAYYFLTRSTRHVPALQSATILLMQPVLNPFWAWLMQGERPGGMAMLGGAVIMLAAFAGAWWHARDASPALS